MLAMAIKAISVAGMGGFFMDEKQVCKMATAYKDVSQSTVHSACDSKTVFKTINGLPKL